MGYPVEQQKYQALGSVWLRFPGAGEVTGYRHQLDLDTAIATTRYEQGGVAFTREVFASPVDQVIVVRLVADQPGKIAFRAQLRGARNQAHSNYATDYFRMDGVGTHGLVVRGKSADYLGVRGALRYEARLEAAAEGGGVRVEDDTLVVEGANAVTLFVAAATSFVTYKDVSADPEARVKAALGASLGTLARRDPPGPRRRAPASLPARVDRPRDDRRLRPPHGRAAPEVHGRQRPRAPRPPLPVRPLPAHLLLAASGRRATGTSRTSTGSFPAPRSARGPLPSWPRPAAGSSTSGGSSGTGGRRRGRRRRGRGSGTATGRWRT